MITIPLLNGASNAHQSFEAQCGDNLLQFTVDYITDSGPAWSMNVSLADVTLMSGLMLEPNAILTETYMLSIGKLIFVGDEVTLDNLGTDNSLVWMSDDE